MKVTARRDGQRHHEQLEQVQRGVHPEIWNSMASTKYPPH